MSARRRIIPVFVPHAGCENACVFCNQRRISGAAAPATPETVRAAVESARTQGCPAELAFYGGSFTAIPEREQNALLAAAQPFLRLDPGNSIRISTRPDSVSEKTAIRLRESGVATVELGAQSMCDRVLAASKRGHTAEDVVSAAKAVKSAGLALILQMMTGLPGDTPADSRYTAERFISLSPDGVRIYPTVVVRDTELYELWRRGDYREHTVEEAVLLCAELYVLFEAARIPITRMGLNPTEELSGGGAAAGAYHPAFGELVYSRVYLERALKLLADVPPQSDVLLRVARGCTSIMTGRRKSNINTLKERLALRSVKVKEAEQERGKITVEILREKVYNNR